MPEIVTKQQIEVEKKIQKMAEDLPTKKAEETIVALLDYARSKNIFSKEDIRGYEYRRDKTKDNKPRSNVQFIKYLQSTHARELWTFERFYNYMCQEEKKKELRLQRRIDWKPHGSDVKGYVMIAYFGNREEKPTEPDFEMIIGDRKQLVEAKNFYAEHWFKVDNLKKYKETKAWIIVGNKGEYYLYGKNAVDLLLKKENKAINRFGKPSIIVSKNREEKSHFILQDLIDKKLVRII